MTDWFEDLPEVVHEAEIVPARTDKNAQLEKLQAMEDRILEKSASQVLDGLHYADIDPDTDTPPAAWVEELGMERAMDRLRAAKYNLLPSSEAPVGAKHAIMVHAAITKARAQEKNPQTMLNIGKVYLTVAPPVFPEKKLDPDE